MKSTAPFLLKQYAKMSGDKKVRIGMSLSSAVRRIREEGKKYKKAPAYGN